MKLEFRWSWWGAAAAGFFLLMAASVFLWIFFVASKNSADSGESGLWLLPFAMPWIMIIPSSWLGPFTGLGAILGNVLIVYLVFGGLRIHRGKP